MEASNTTGTCIQCGGALPEWASLEPEIREAFTCPTGRVCCSDCLEADLRAGDRPVTPPKSYPASLCASVALQARAFDQRAVLAARSAPSESVSVSTAQHRQACSACDVLIEPGDVITDALAPGMSHPAVAHLACSICPICATWLRHGDCEGSAQARQPGWHICAACESAG